MRSLMDSKVGRGVLRGEGDLRMGRRYDSDSLASREEKINQPNESTETETDPGLVLVVPNIKTSGCS